VIGARSAVFAPLDHIGFGGGRRRSTILPTSRREGLAYNAKELARFRPKRKPPVLISFIKDPATPSLESYHAAMKGRGDIAPNFPSRVTGHDLL